MDNGDRRSAAAKAERLRELHHGTQLLVLPNVWDPLGGLLLEHLGAPAVATASAAVAYSLGYDDGQRMPFATMLEAVHRLAAVVTVPVTADIEGGYAEDRDGLAANVCRVIEAGAVGINIEDGLDEGAVLRGIGEQLERIRLVREAATRCGVPLVINARTDVFLRSADGTGHRARLREAVERGRAYLEAGADCVYPILLADLPSLRELGRELAAPINVLATAGTPSQSDLEAAGVRRLSTGPGLLRAAVTTMRDVARGLLEGGAYEDLAQDALSSDEIRKILRGRG